MNIHQTKLLALSAVFCTTSLFAAYQSPTLFIKTVHNTTPYDILLVDRLAEDNNIILPARKTTTVHFTINTQNKVIINGSMSDIMAEDAQYAFVKLDQNGNAELNQEVYFNVYMSAGGVDNGNRCTVGTIGSIALNFYVAGKNGGCMMKSNTVDTNGSEIAEFELELSMNKEDIQSNVFRMNIHGKLTCK